ncbi:hypothetical protein UCDDS831_g05387 [Diplodia seriata]|uniref:DUF7492 domain-containing protein n=1 Tax=Diplodia seriata TaxID=420778 RepID=A0A0G2G6R7_9PEZI|nr:hypothetical protein UCDDS831_g05387 [Diplodia seriata]
MTNSIFGLLAAALLLTQVAAHTWIEQLAVIKDGAYVGNYGYPRGYLSRTDPGFNGGASSQWLLPPLDSARLRVNDSDNLCRKEQQTQTQTEKWPRLSVAPGDYVAMKYGENGHVTLPDNQKGKPEKGGTVFVYGTTEPNDDEKLTTVLKWTKDGTGGDKRGKLLATNNFDDGRCYQINSGPISTQRQKEFPDPNPGQPDSYNEQYCETDVQIPEDQEAGKTYTLYWVWQWPTAAGKDPTYPQGKDEWYTTCSDVDLTSANSLQSFAAGGTQQKYKLDQQDPQSKAVSSYSDRSALTTDPAQGMAAASGASSGASNAATTPGTTPSSSAASAATPTAGASDPLETVFVTVTASPTAKSMVTQMVTVTGPVPLVTQYLTSTIGLAARGASRRSKAQVGSERRSVHHRRGAAVKVDSDVKPDSEEEQTAPIGFIGTESIVGRQVATGAAPSTMAAPSLMTTMMILFTIAYVFA